MWNVMMQTFSMLTTETPKQHYFLEDIHPLWPSRERVMFARVIHKSSCVSWVCGEAWSVLHHAFGFPFFGSNPLIGCFKSISVNMAEIMRPKPASKRILFVKPAWYSSHSLLNHLVAVFALSQWNITLSDLVVLSLATSLKWVMIINPIGHVQWNPIDLHIPGIVCIHINPQTNWRRMHKPLHC